MPAEIRNGAEARRRGGLTVPTRAWLFVTVLLSLATPGRAREQDDLSTIYQTRRAEPALNHNGEMARRVEAILRKQARHLAAGLGPWKDDSRALLLTSGNSNEHGIRPNVHTAFGLAVL